MKKIYLFSLLILFTSKFFGQTVSICAGQSTTLTAPSGTGNYTWTPPIGLSSSSGSVVVASPSVTTTYTIIQGVGTTTTVLGALTVSVIPVPTVAVTPTLTTICAGQTAALSASGPGPFNWVASSGVYPYAIANVNVSPIQTTTYTVKAGVGTCTTSAIAIVMVSNTTSISITPSVSAICAGQTKTLVTTGFAPFIWTASNGPNPTSTATVVVSPTVTTTYTVLTGTGSCTATAIATVAIVTAPTITITPTATTICAGQTVSLSTSGSGPFNWTASSGSNPSATANVTVSPTSTTTYTVLSGTGSCTATAVATVSLTTVPNVSVTPSSTVICNGLPVNLSATGSGPFSWTASSGTNPSPTALVTISPNTTTTYTVLSGTGACTTAAVATVSVSPNFTINITPSNTTICLGSNSTLSATGATSYTWFPGASTGASITVSPTSNTTYSVVGINGACANASTAQVNVTIVNTSLSASSSLYCIGSPAIVLTGGGATTYNWAPSTGLSSTTGSTVSLTPTSTSIYSVTGTTSGCSNTQTISITVAPNNNINASATNTFICAGSTTTLSATGANTYTWNPGFTNNSTLVVNPVTTTSYTISGTTALGCNAIPGVITISVSPAINPTLTASSPTTCLSQSITINAAPVSGGLTYTWQPVSAIQGGNNGASIVALPTTTSTVAYSVIVSNGVCVGTKTIQILVQTPPSANFITTSNDTICTGGCVTFSSTTTGVGPFSYQWLFIGGNPPLSSQASPQTCYSSAGAYTVAMIASNGCGADTAVKNNFIKVFDTPNLVVSGDTSINIGEHTIIHASGALSYNWSPNINGSIACPTCSNTVVYPANTTQYIVIASNTQYCQDQDTVTVMVDINCGAVFVPTAFSPNNDGLNDFLNIHGRCITNFNMQIFNRLGEKVFETSSLTENWDGTYKGEKLNTGVFMYKANGNLIDGKTFDIKGNITLLR